MNTFRNITIILFIIAAFLVAAGCTTTAVPPDEVVQLPPTNTPEPMDTVTAAPSPTVTSSPTPLPTATITPTPTPTIKPSPTLTPTPDAEALFDAHMQQGMKYAEEENWEDAADAFLDAIAVDPNNEKISRAYNNLGLVYQKLGEWELAIGNFDQAIALEPDNADYYANRGDVWRASEEIDKALADYDRAIELDPESPRYFYNRAIAYKQLSEFELALADYDQTILLSPDFAYAYHNRANIHWDMGNYEQALADFDMALTLDPTDKIGFMNRGLLHQALGDPEAAQADFTQITTLCDPVSFSVNGGAAQNLPVDEFCTLAYLRLAPLDYELGEYEAALADLKSGIFSDQELALEYLDSWVLDHPTSGFAFFARGCAEESLDDLAAAQADFTRAIQLNGSGPLAQEYYFRRGFVYAMQDNLEAAVADWQKTIAIEPTYAHAYHNLAFVYGELGDYETAVTTLQIALSQGIPQDYKFDLANMLMEYAEYLANFSENSNQAATAIAAIQAVQTEMPEFVISAMRLNNICWYTSLWDLAEEVLFACELAVEMEPEDGGIRDSRGLARALTGDFEGAIEDFQFFIAWGPDNQRTPEEIALREEWIVALEAGINPFTETLLAELRSE